ncbi:MAG: aspartate aminotransferase family protein [Negativicutes bacterium]|nr:aspartate aminotransferase family protein [Negativicutes bacterium]
MDDHVFYPMLRKRYPVIVKAKGLYLWDADGKRYIDACCGALVSNIGHGVEEVNEAIIKQLREVAFTHRFKFTNRPVQELATLIADLSPGDINWVTFMSGGSEATETAMKMAREYYIEKGKPSKYKIIARWQSYHGNTLGALSMSGHIGRRRRYAPLLADFPHVPPAYCYRCSWGKKPDTCSLECAAEVEAAILREGPDNVAAFILEPVVGSSIGAAVPKDGYLQTVRTICDKYDILLIADEVMTGLGRTGAAFAVDHWQTLPDMLCMAKGISGGYAPLGAVAVRDHIREAFSNGSGRFAHGFTFGGNPIAAAAGKAVISFVLDHGLIERSRATGAYLLEELRRLAAKHEYIGDVRGLGLMTAVEFVQDKISGKPFAASQGLTDKVVGKALDRGLMLYGAGACADGVSGDAVMIAPPLTVSEAEINEILSVFEDTLEEVFGR